MKTSQSDNRIEPIEQQREQLQSAYSERSRLVQELAEKRQLRDKLVSAHGAKDERAQAAEGSYRQTLGALTTAREAVQQARVRLDAAVAGMLGSAPSEDIARLVGDLPVVMMPVRLETRFAYGHQDHRYAGVLRLRIYPDAIIADGHEPLLSRNEIEAGQDYWRLAWQKADERDAWAALLKETTAARAAWIVEQTTPVNLEELPQEPFSEEGGSQTEPKFGELPVRPHNWRRATEARLLPDRWLVRLYRRYPAANEKDVREVVSSPVRDSLTLALSLSQDGSEEVLDNSVALSNDGLRIDPELMWTVDYERALESGMAVNIDLTREELEAGYARIVVLGIKSTQPPELAAIRLGELLDSHHFAHSTAFVRQGTPTNNTKDGGAGFPVEDPNGARSYAIERAKDRQINAGDGARVAKALGVSAERLKRIDGAEHDEQRAARAMAEVLWPATAGYFLEQLMAPYIEDEVIDEARRYVVEHVRGRGPWPALRIGEVPYGLMPVSSLTRWKADDDGSALESNLPGLLKNMRELWRKAAQKAPRVAGSNDADRDLMSVLGLDASAREVYVRTCIGPQTLANTDEFIETATTFNDSPQFKAAQALVNLLGIDPDWVPRVALLGYGNDAHKFGYGFVVDDPAEPLSETRGLKFDYINWIRNADPERLRDERLPGGVEKPRALLYLMLRHAAMTEYARQARSMLIRLKMANHEERIEREFVNIMPKGEAAEGQAGRERAREKGAGKSSSKEYAPTVWDRMGQTVPGVTGGMGLGKYLAMHRAESQGPEDERLRKYREALAVLEGLPTAELERLFSETLDVFSHRLDAWVTSLAGHRLEKLRVRKPAGCHVGAYGWLEEVRANPQAKLGQEMLDDKHSVLARRDTGGGYIHAPSMNQAVAAAVLRNGYLTRSSQSREPYAVNLSSARVRRALWFLDAVREGQPIGAVLGYQFERGLHERHPGYELDKFIDGFRNHYPLVANKTRQSGLPAESVAARHVVDGKALREAWRNSTQRRPGGIPWASLTPQPTANEQREIEAELRELDDTVDAISDLLMAESVYQIVLGNSSGTGASLDGFAKGVRPPEPQIVRTPRSGTDILHRVTVVLGSEPPGAALWANAAQRTPRALAEPVLNGWVGALLGDPAKVVCQVRFKDAANGTEARPTVSLAQLQAAPLDVLAMARAFEGGVATDFARAAIGDSEIGRRILDVALGQSRADGPIQILFDMPLNGSDERGFPEVLEMGRAINALLGSARALRPGDLLPPEEAGMAGSAVLMPGELVARANQALSDLDLVRKRLRDALVAIEGAAASDPVAVDELRAALKLAAASGSASAYPPPRPDDISKERLALIELGKSVVQDLDGRYSQALSEPNPVTSLQHVFGRQFLVLPRFVPPQTSGAGAPLDQVFRQGPRLGAHPKENVARWLMQAARVRKPLRQWRRLALYAGAAGQDLAEFAVAQFPWRNDADWVGLPFTSADRRPVNGSTSLLMHGDALPGMDQPWAGLLLDEWQEKIPGLQEDTAVSFHFDSPNAEAPQAVLLAVHPQASGEDKHLDALRWDVESLVETLNETLDMARMRLVTGEQLAELSQALPMTYLASNPANETVSTSFAGYLLAAVTLQAAEN